MMKFLTIIAMLAKNYNKVMRRLDKLSGKNASHQQHYQKGGSSQGNGRDGDRHNNSYSSKESSHEYGFGHFQKEFSNFLKKKKGL